MGADRIVREFWMDMYTLLYLKWIANEDLLYSPGMLWGSLDGKGVWGEWIHVYMWLGPFAVHLKLSHCQLTVPQHKIKSFLKMKQKRYFWRTIFKYLTHPILTCF